MKKNTAKNRIFIGLIFFFLYVPIALLIVFSFNATKSRTVWAGFSLEWYKELFHNTRIIEAFGTTLTVSILAAVIATVLGTLAAIGFFRMRRRPRQMLMSINNIPMTNADIITGVSMMLLFLAAVAAFNGTIGKALHLELQLGFWSLLIAHITFNVPYVLLSVLPKLYQMDPNLLEAAQDLGATPWRAFWKVLLPEIRPGVLNGALIAFTMSIDDFVISYFTAGSNVSTLAMEIYAMARRRISPEINALSTLLFVAILLLLIVINVREARQSKAARQKGASLN